MSYFDYLKKREAKYGIDEEEKGQRYERAVLGECNIQQGEQVNVAASKTEALEFAIAHQPEEKTVPMRWIERQINNVIKEVENIEMFTAVGSPADYDFGTDAIIKAGGQYFTIDYTTGTKEAKLEKAKSPERIADMVFELDLDMDEEKKIEAINKFALYAAGFVDSSLRTIRKYQEEMQQRSQAL